MPRTVANKSPKNPKSPRKKRPFVGRLDSIKSCRMELARIYRAARLNAGAAIDLDSGYKASLIIATAAKLVADGELETRLAEVEARLAEQNGGPRPLRRVS